MEQTLLKLLELINQNAHLNQKKMAEKSGISVGKINYLIHELTYNNYIYNEKKGRNINYYLTEQGINFLKNGFAAFQEKKVNIHSEPAKKITQAVILAAGTRKEFSTPAGLLQIENNSLLKRNIDILRTNGIEQIVIVTGFQNEAFNGIAEFNDVQFVNNSQYKWTGSMASLILAYEYVSNDFLLIEDDILIEERAIKQILSHPQRDCILITNESGSGDEAFVEIRNGYLHKISKDIHQFNHVDGEMLGISKISYEVFNEMVNNYKLTNKNPYMNYEYMLLDVSKHYKIGFLKMFNLVWGEVDSLHQYNIVINKIYPILKRKEAEYREKQIKKYMVEALDLDYEDIQEIQPFGGMTNKNYKVTVNDRGYVLRVPGNGTEKMINRKEEKFNSIIASDLGIDTNLVYFDDNTGIKIAELIPNAETLNSKTSKRQDYMEMTSLVFQKLHNCNAKMPNRFDVFEKMNEYEFLLREVNGQLYDHYNEVKNQVLVLKAVYQSLNVKLTPCHNDPVPENFVKSGNEKIYLIDWEYGGMNDPMWDLAAYSLECDFSPEEEELYLTLYLNQKVIRPEIQKRLLMNKIFQDFLWSIWTIIKEAKGDDFGSYGINRFTRCRENLNNKLIKEITNELKI